MKILLDTDIGSDIDDAVALAYLLAQPACTLLGITTVSGQPVERAKLASALCRAAGVDVPILPGIEAPLLAPQRQPACPQSAMLDRWPHASDFPRNEAIDFLRSTIRAHPGEVTLLAIGPMTNVAALFTIDSEIPALLGGLIMMIGAFGVGPAAAPATGAATAGPRAEWNALCDPHAAAIVYRAPVKLHRSVGLDVTLQVQMGATEVRSRFAQGLLRPVRDFADVWFRERPAITFHDPLAAASLFDDGLCTFQRGTVAVDLAGDLAGQTLWQAGAGPHEVAHEVHPERFFGHFFDVMGQRQG
jgi:inosine-uridine nucleoside N-ribohydrolase